MKRKGRHSANKAEVKPENGLDDTKEENGNNTDEPEEKKRKSTGKGKQNKNASKKDGSKNEEKSEDEKEESDSDSGEYEVEKVLNDKIIKGVKHYLIRWKGYEPESDTWEPESTLDCPELISEYENKAKKGKGKIKDKKKEKSSVKEDDWNENDDFEVDRILEVHFKKDGAREFLVSWKGYPSSQNSWEPEENMDCVDMIKRFMSKVEKAKESDSKELRVNRKHTDRFTLTMASTGRRLSKRQEGRQRVHYHDAE